MHSGTVTVLSTEEQLSNLKDEENRFRICVLKTPKFWQWCDKSRATYSKGGEKRKQWTNVRVSMYNTDCNFKKDCIIDCKKTGNCKLYAIRTYEGVEEIKRLNNNAKIPFRGTPEATSYDLAAAQSAIAPAHGKYLAKTGVSLAIPPVCYGIISPRYGLPLKKLIDVGAGLVDRDYRGKLALSYSILEMKILQ